MKTQAKRNHKRDPKSGKDKTNTDLKSTQKVDRKLELASAMEGGCREACARGPWGPVGPIYIY